MQAISAKTDVGDVALRGKQEVDVCLGGFPEMWALMTRAVPAWLC